MPQFDIVAVRTVSETEAKRRISRAFDILLGEVGHQKPRPEDKREPSGKAGQSGNGQREVNSHV